MRIILVFVGILVVGAQAQQCPHSQNRLDRATIASAYMTYKTSQKLQPTTTTSRPRLGCLIPALLQCRQLIVNRSVIRYRASSAKLRFDPLMASVLYR